MPGAVTGQTDSSMRQRTEVRTKIVRPQHHREDTMSCKIITTRSYVIAEAAALMLMTAIASRDICRSRGGRRLDLQTEQGGRETICGASGQNLLPFRFLDYIFAPCPRMGKKGYY